MTPDLTGAAEIPRLVAAQLREIAGAQGAVFYDVRDTRPSCVPLEYTGPACPELPKRGSLVRWLRVNGEVLRLPERREILDDASDEERAFATSRCVRAGVPLVADRALVAAVFLLDERPSWHLPDARADELATSARQWALGWRDATRRDAVMARARAEYRSQQLSVAGELAASTAHEVRNPLAAIRSIVQFVRDSDPDASERAQLLGDVIEEVDRIDRTVGGLLHLSRPHPTERQLINLDEMVTRAAHFIAPYARKKSVQIDAPAAAAGLSVFGDPHELRQVFVNVLLNACQACNTGGRVAVTTRIAEETEASRDRRTAEVIVADTGHGISPETLARVFDAFYTTKPDGTGLGLATCREILQRHDGAISLNSRIDVGTEVTIRMPIS